MDAVAYNLETLRKALTKTDVLLSASGSDPSKLQEAGRVMCEALGTVLAEEGDDHASMGLLAQLRQELADTETYRMAWSLRRSDILELRRLLYQPVVATVLMRLGYQPPPATGVLVGDIVRHLRSIAAVPPREPPSYFFDQAKAAIENVRREICELARTGETPQRLRMLINEGRSYIGKVLFAAVVVPTAAAAAAHFGPEFLHLLEELLGRMAELWAVVSMGAVAAIPPSDKEMAAPRASIGSAGAPTSPNVAEVDARQPEGQTRILSGAEHQDEESRADRQTSQPSTSGIDQSSVRLPSQQFSAEQLRRFKEQTGRLPGQHPYQSPANSISMSKPETNDRPGIDRDRLLDIAKQLRQAKTPQKEQGLIDELERLAGSNPGGAIKASRPVDPPGTHASDSPINP
jgi:hypothetical protein